MQASDIDAFYAAFMPLQIAKVADHAAPIPHSLEVFEQIRSRGIKIGSCSGYPRQVMDVLIDAASDYGYRPDYVVATDDLAQGGRPALYGTQNVIELGVTDVRACVKVDDALPGIEEGHNAGCGRLVYCCQATKPG